MVKVEVEICKDILEDAKNFLLELGKDEKLSLSDFVSFCLWLACNHLETIKFASTQRKVDKLYVGVCLDIPDDTQQSGGDRVAELEAELRAIKSLLSGAHEVHPMASELPLPTKDEIQNLFRSLAA